MAANTHGHQPCNPLERLPPAAPLAPLSVLGALAEFQQPRRTCGALQELALMQLTRNQWRRHALTP